MQDKPLVSVLMTAYNREKYIVEAMKAGVITLVTNWEGATDELITEGKTGYYFERQMWKVMQVQLQC